MRLRIALPAIALLVAFHSVCAESSGEVVGGADDDPPPPIKAPEPEKKDTQAVSRLPLTVDEPDFKATVTFPEQPVPKVDQSTRPKDVSKPKKREFNLPQEEGVNEKPPAETTDETAENKNETEEISPALAKVIAKEKGKKSKELTPLYAEVVTAEPENAEAHYRLGVALIRGGDLAKGLPELESAGRLKPKNSKYLCDFGLGCLRAGWYEKGLIACQTAALNSPSNPRFQSAAGDAFLANGKINEAVESYKRAMTIDPQNPEYMHNLGKAYLIGRAYKLAGEVFDEAIKLRPDHTPFYCSRGLAWQSSKNIKEAIQCYMVAIKIDKNDAYAHYLLASCYSDPDDPTYTNAIDAITHAEKACKLSEFKNAQYLMGMARALRVGHNYEQAVIIARKAIELDPNDEYRQEMAKFEQLRTEGGRK
jgi:tetratricopeptide (TPR) repeat protein